MLFAGKKINKTGLEGLPLSAEGPQQVIVTWSALQDQRFVGAEATSDRMEQQDPAVQTEVKVEIDVAEEPQKSSYMTEKHPRENTAIFPVRQASESRALPSNHSGVLVKQEVITDESADLLMGQTPVTQTSHGSQNNICIKQEVTDNQLLNHSEVTRTAHVQPFQTVKPTDDCTQGTTPAAFSESGRSAYVHSIQIGFTGSGSPQDKYVRDETFDCKAQCHACQQCEAKFTYSRDLKRHMLTHKRQKYYSCQQCDAKFTRSSHLKQHRLIHTGQKPYACEQCDAKFTQPSGLKQHTLVHTQQKPYVCQLCDARLRCSNSLKRHMLIHTGQKHACQLCDAKFSWSSSLKQHMMIHTGENQHVCQECGAQFTRPSHLKQHMLTHTGQKPYACEQCDAKFSRLSNLKRHTLTHTDQEPRHVCQLCDAKLRCSSSLKRHMLMHTGQKYACQQCDAKFSCASSLKWHMFTHTGQKHYSCQHCDAKFSRSNNLKRHMSVHTGQKNA